MKSLFLTRDQALSLWSGSTDSKNLDYQRTNPMWYWIVGTHTQKKPLEYKTQCHTTTCCTLCRMPYLNNKQNKNTNPIISKQDYCSLSLAHQRKNKQKLSTNLTQYEAYTNHWTKLRRAEIKRKKEFNLLQGKNSTLLKAWEKETSNTVS